MSQKGESKTQKSIAVEKARFIKRKKNVWTIRTSPGPHSKEFSVPLGFVVREMLGIAGTLFEAKKILGMGSIVVNGVARKEPKFPVGLFDVLLLVESKKKYRLVFDDKGRLVLSEMEDKSPLEKVSKILFKKAVKKGLVQLTTDDGFVFLEKKTAFRPGDSLKISLPEKKILDGLELKKGNMVYMIGGKKIGKTGTVLSVSDGTRSRPKLVGIEIDGKEILTVEKNTMVIGKGTPSVDFGKAAKKSGIE